MQIHGFVFCLLDSFWFVTFTCACPSGTGMHLQNPTGQCFSVWSFVSLRHSRFLFPEDRVEKRCSSPWHFHTCGLAVHRRQGWALTGHLSGSQVIRGPAELSALHLPPLGGLYYNGGQPLGQLGVAVVRIWEDLGRRIESIAVKHSVIIKECVFLCQLVWMIGGEGEYQIYTICFAKRPDQFWSSHQQ